MPIDTPIIINQECPKPQNGEKFTGVLNYCFLVFFLNKTYMSFVITVSASARASSLLSTIESTKPILIKTTKLGKRLKTSFLK